MNKKPLFRSCLNSCDLYNYIFLDKVSKQDVGNYSCKAVNIYGNDVKKISVQVVGEITFITEPQDVNVTMGSRVELNCQAQGMYSVAFSFRMFLV